MTFGQPSFSSSVSSISTTMAEAHKSVRQDSTKYNASTLPLNMYQTVVHQGERLEFAQVKRIEQPEFSKEEGREGAATLRDPRDNQLSKYDDDSSDNDSDGFAVEEDAAIHDMQSEELGFLFASFSFFSMKREMPILFFMNCESTVLFSMKHDLDPIYHPHDMLCILFVHFHASC